MIHDAIATVLMHPFKTCVRCAHMAFEVSSYDELLSNWYTPNHIIQAFLELILGVLIVADLQGIRADNRELSPQLPAWPG